MTTHNPFAVNDLYFSQQTGFPLERTGDIGLISVLGDSGVAAGVRRIEALTGKTARKAAEKQVEVAKAAAAELKVPLEDLAARIASLLDERKKFERELTDARKKLAMGGGAGAGSKSADEGVRQVNGVKLIARAVTGIALKDLRSLADEGKKQVGSGVVAIVGLSEDGKAGLVGSALGSRGNGALSHPLPAGMRDLLPEEASRQLGLIRSILGSFARFGYEPVSVPPFEYAAVLEHDLGPLDSGQVLRFVEPETGEIVALRPDMTPQIARLVAMRLADAPPPVRLCYEGAVVRRRAERASRASNSPGRLRAHGASWPGRGPGGPHRCRVGDSGDRPHRVHHRSGALESGHVTGRIRGSRSARPHRRSAVHQGRRGDAPPRAEKANIKRP